MGCDPRLDTRKATTRKQSGVLVFKNIGFWGVIMFAFIGFVIVAILTHANGFSSAAGTLFTGVNGLGETLEGNSQSNTRSGGQSRASRMAFAA